MATLYAIECSNVPRHIITKNNMKYRIEYSITHYYDCEVEAGSVEEAEALLIDSGMQLGGEYDLQSEIIQTVEVK